MWKRPRKYCNRSIEMNRPTYFAICIAERLWIMAAVEVEYACKFTPNSFLECFDHVPLRFYFLSGALECDDSFARQDHKFLSFVHFVIRKTSEALVIQIKICTNNNHPQRSSKRNCKFCLFLQNAQVGHQYTVIIL